MTTDLKTCRACCESKPLGAFGRVTRHKDGLNSYCRDCVKAKSKKYWDEFHQKLLLSPREPAAPSAFKTCRTCCESKPLSDFQRNNGRKDGLQSYCRDCIRIRGEKWYADPANKEKASARGKVYQKATKEARKAHDQARYLTMNVRTSTLFHNAKKRAASRGMECTISTTWLRQRWGEIGGLCEVTGLPMSLNRSPENSWRHPFNPSLDRRDNSKGYTKENTRFVCVIVNIAINDFGEADFTTMCKAVAARS